MAARYIRVFVRMSITWAVAAFAAAGQCSGQEPSIANSELRLTFDGENGALATITDRARKRELLADGSNVELWSVEFADGHRIAPADAAVCSWHVGPTGTNELVIRWSDFKLVDAPDVAVEVTVKLDSKEAVSDWSIAVDAVGQRAVRSVAFPRVGLVRPQEVETLIVPQWIGESTQAARRILNPSGGRAGRLAWDYPGIMSMQFLALYGGNGAGLMLSTDDTDHRRKQFAAFGDGKNGLGLEVVHFAAIAGSEDTPNASFDPGYKVRLRGIDGDWYTAAVHYREWAGDQWWVQQSRLRRGLTPEWVRGTGLWVWNRGRSNGVLAPAIALQKKAQQPVSVFWHWWHGCAYDVGFPEYLPPREGESSFRTAVANAHEHDVRSIVYMNQRLWGMTTKSWSERNAAAFAVKQPDGTIAPEVYNKFMKAPCASMCLATPFWRNTYAELAAEAVIDLGVDGIYMDQACTSLACFDPTHQHPLGGGTYWMDGFKKLQADIRQRCADKKSLALAGEGCGEAWLPYLDMMLAFQVSLERYKASDDWEPLPLFHAVYHDCSTLFGSYSSLTRPPYDELWPKETAPKDALAMLDRKFAAQFRLEQARSFVWGQQPTLANFQERQLTERREEIEFVLQIGRWREASLKFLRDGVFLRPPKIDTPHKEIPMSRLSIYAGQQGAVRESRKVAPVVLASAWRARDGSIGVAVANIGDEREMVQFELSRDEYDLPKQVLLRTTLDQKVVKSANTARTTSFSLELAPRAVSVCEIVEDRR